MPQASDDLRHKWHGPSEFYAIDFLQRRGYFLRSDWTWIPPERPATPDELEAVTFLIDEWDFGGIATDRRDPSPPAPHNFNIINFPFNIGILKGAMFDMLGGIELHPTQKKLLQEFKTWLANNG